MASIPSIRLYSGSKLIGSPVVFEVTAGTPPTGATFHRVLVTLTVNGNDFEFSSPATAGEKLYFDISKAMQSVASKFEYTADGLNPIPSAGYPAYGTAAGDGIKACDVYLLNGEERKSDVVTGTISGPYFVGRLTDRERMLFGTSAQELPLYWSRKPYKSAPEIVFTGMTLIIPGAYSVAPRVTTMEIIAATKPANINGSSNAVSYYPTAAPKDSYEIRFINSLGVHESIHVACLPLTETHIQTDKYVFAKQETLTKFSRGIMHKQNDYETWKMSSGPLNRAWQQWYLHEPLMAEVAWIKIDGVWLPCHIVPEETVTGADRTKAGALTVEFVIQFDINGSPFK